MPPTPSLRATRRRVAELEAEVARLKPLEADLALARARLASLPNDLGTLVAVAVEAVRAELEAHVNDDTRHLPGRKR